MPRIPLAPSDVESSSAGPIALHAEGIGATLGSITCMGTEDAFSPARRTSALFTGPHTTLLTNCAHSTVGLPLPSFCCGRELFRAPKAEASTRSPNDPVSTSTALMFWQLELAGAQIVTVVKTPLTWLFWGPPFTTMACTLLLAAPWDEL